MKFKIRFQENQKIKKVTLDANNIIDLKSLSTFPSNVICIKEVSKMNLDFDLFKNNKKDIFEFFSQLDIMLSAHLSFNESIELLLKSKQEKIIYEILMISKQSLSSSIALDQALLPYEKYLGKTPILFLKLGFENGNIKESVHSIVEILNEDMDSTEKLIDVLRYPAILLGSLFLSISMIFVYVLPNFDFIFVLLKDDIPVSTGILLMIRDVLNEYSILIVLFIVGSVLLVTFLIKTYRYSFDEIILLRVPILSKMIQDYYFYRLFLSISIIVRSKFQFQLAILNSKNIVNNLYVKDTMNQILSNITNGTSISGAFEKSNIFDDLTIKLLQTADYTNAYESILSSIATQYKKRFHKSLKNFSSIIEPILIFIIALIVLWLILAIMLPIWNLGSVIH